jgi:hypothetical protein
VPESKVGESVAVVSVRADRVATFEEAVAGNTAVTTPEFARFVSVVAPETVKKFSLTPVSV